jgi:hypothetical protein
MKIANNRLFSHERNDLREGPHSAAPAPSENPGTPSGPKLGAKRSQVAFALTETLVATAVLAVMAVSLYGGISFCFSNVNLARQNLRATQIALEKMEIIRMYSWDDVNMPGFVPVTFTAPYYPAETGDTNGGITYFGTTTITNVTIVSPYAVDMRQVLVHLEWTNRNVRQSVDMSTFISQYGMQRYIY